jgi:hypothetical protein
MRSLRTILALLLLLALALGIYATRNVDSDYPEQRSIVYVYEDGSGVQYVGTTEVRTFPHDTFATW